MAEYEKLPEGYNLDTRIGEARSAANAANAAEFEKLPQGYRLPGTPESPREKDWGSASWPEVAESGLKNAPQSAINAITAIPNAIYNWRETGEGLKQVGTGIVSKVRGSTPGQDPEQKAKDEAAVNAIIAPYTSWAGFKKSLATDPFEVLSTAALPLSGGASVLSKTGTALKGAGAAGKVAGTVLDWAGKAVAAPTYFMDPLKGVMKGASLATENIVKPIAEKTVSYASDLSPTAMSKSYEAGRSADPKIKSAFNDYAKGNGDPVAFSRSVQDAIDKIRSAKIEEWKTDKNKLAQLNADVDFSPIYAAINEERRRIGPSVGGVGPSVGKAHEVLDLVEDQLRFRESLPPGDPLRTVAGVDQLKQSLYKDSKAASGAAADAYNRAWAGTRQSLFDAAPDYIKSMDDYQAINENLDNIRKTLGAGRNVAANAEMAKFIRQQDSASGNQLISQLGEIDPTIPYKVAGATFHESLGKSSNWDRALTLSQLAAAGAAFYHGQPHLALGALGSALGTAAVNSPTAVRAATYGSGELAGSKLGAAGRGAGTAYEAGRKIGTGPLLSLEGQREDVREGRTARASGGRTIGHDEISDRLVRMADQVRKQVSTHTEKLLDTPDDHIAKALEIANRDI